MPRKENLDGTKLKAGQKRATPGVAIKPSHESLETRTAKHPNLAPVTLTGLIDAFKLNEIPFKHELDGQYELMVEAKGLKREINPYRGSEILQFFKDVICLP